MAAPTSTAASSASSFKSVASTHEPNNTTASETPASSSSKTSAASPLSPPQPEWLAPPGVLKTPVLRPMNTSKPPPPTKLSDEQETKYAAVLANVTTWTSIPATTAKAAPQSPIQDHERMWLTRECLLRYLRATKWSTPNALKRLQATLSWRREYGADTFTADYISPENETGKQLVLGYDKQARPCLYLNPAKQNTKMSDRQINHLCFMLDRTIDMMPPGQESACLLIDFKGATSGTVPTVGQARAVLNILQGHSPERLGKAVISDTPWYVTTFFKLISGFIDPVTKEKMKFNEPLADYVPKEQLWKHYKGDLDFEYEHKSYWPALNKECNERRAAYRKRWEEAGKHIGEFEIFLRGGDHPSIGEVLKRKGAQAVGGETADADLVAAEVGRLTVQE